MNAAFKEILNSHINDSDLIQLSFCENLCLCTNFDTAVKLRLESLVVLLTAGRMVSIGPGTEPRWHMMLVKCLQWYSSWPSGTGAGKESPIIEAGQVLLGSRCHWSYWYWRLASRCYWAGVAGGTEAGQVAGHRFTC